jgi:hypothetical protein
MLHPGFLAWLVEATRSFKTSVGFQRTLSFVGNTVYHCGLCRLHVGIGVISILPAEVRSTAPNTRVCVIMVTLVALQIESGIPPCVF